MKRRKCSFEEVVLVIKGFIQFGYFNFTHSYSRLFVILAILTNQFSSSKGGKKIQFSLKLENQS